MTKIMNREKYRRIDNQIWKRTRVDGKGQTTLPKKLREKLGIEGKGTKILWICVNQKNQNNLFLIEVGVKK